jgi:hypothetical protein
MVTLQRLAVIVLVLSLGCAPKTVTTRVNIGDAFEVISHECLAFQTIDQAFDFHKLVKAHNTAQEMTTVVIRYPAIASQIPAWVKSGEAKQYQAGDRFTLVAQGHRALSGRKIEFYQLDSGYWLCEDEIHTGIFTNQLIQYPARP